MMRTVALAVVVGVVASWLLAVVIVGVAYYLWPIPT